MKPSEVRAHHEHEMRECKLAAARFDGHEGFVERAAFHRSAAEAIAELERENERLRAIVADVEAYGDDAMTNMGKYLRPGLEDTDFGGFLFGLQWRLDSRKTKPSRWPSARRALSGGSPGDLNQRKETT